ncbi:flavin monoamine oxidase family protein [Gephyromycinifex aptenodytis]|uniref:flavin monoamine oxidase family protein n=1 Tax=Gephyromycinifex aptenodytis TaxID=2716227 RepID=UPI001447947F|nr:NAD(P)/FAD-dependent oxidoreductase [Gephyromycinifex aptenodytis]
MNTLHRDTVIVGAGACGLSAANRLREAGRSVVVLEARDRVGGRTWTSHIDGAMLEIGGQWVSPDQTELLQLIDELGLSTFTRYREGESVYIDPNGTATRFSGEDFPCSPATVEAMNTLIAELDELAAQIGPEEPWAHPRARELDTVSFADWLRSRCEDEEACRNIGFFIAGGMLTKPAHAFSALQAVLMAASAGSFSHLVDEDFILDRRVVGGMQQVSERLAQRLGDEVLLSHPVRTVSWREGDSGDGQDSPARVEVVADGPDGPVSVQARHVILAIPPNLYSRISYEPPLPRRQHQMHQHQSFGLVIKVHAVYERPFWREAGLSGTGFGCTQLVQEVYDNSNHEDERGTLVAFVPDERADEAFSMDAQQRREAILSSIAAYLGPEALNPVVYYESDWGSEEWTRGAYATSFDLGGLHRYGADMRKPVGPMYFASSDLAAEGYQHVDGAIRMGRRTAQAILDSDGASS